MDFNRGKSNRVNAIKWPLIKMKWEAKLRSVATFKGVMDYEEWAISQSEPIRMDNPFKGMMEDVDNLEDFLRGAEPQSQGWVDPEKMFKMDDGAYMFRGDLGEKEKLFEQAKQIRKQINDAISQEDYEKADILQKTLDVIKLKYDKL